MVREAQVSDLSSIARLHSESFKDHFLPKLGTKLLANYYKEFIDNQNIFIVSVDEENRVIGLVLGTPDSSIGRNQFIRNSVFKLSFKIVLLCLKFDKDTWERVFALIKRIVISKPSEENVDTKTNASMINTISLLSICVSEDAKGHGVAKLLVDDFEKRVIAHGYDGYTLTVHKNNTRANGFYKKLGMLIYKDSGNDYGYLKKLK